jgi:ATP-dependent helicase HrpB
VLLALAYPDRVALRRGDERGRFILRNGRGARVNPASALADAEALAVAETDGEASEARVFIAAPLTHAVIAELFREQVVREDVVDFDEVTLGVLAVRRERLGALVLSERAQHAPDPALVAAAFVAAIRRDGLTALPWNDAATRLRERLAFLHETDAAWPDVSDAALLAELDAWLAPHLAGMRRRAEFARLDMAALLLERLSWSQRGALDALAPTHIEVPSGSRIAVNYADAAAPVLAVRLQELFGSSATPRVAGGRVALTLHLLSPAHRPVQVTRDLAGFWRTTYFDVRKDLRGRYPRHAWPEDPLAAEPTSRAKRR